MATKNRIAYALPIIQIMWRLLAKSPIQICLRLIYGERELCYVWLSNKVNVNLVSDCKQYLLQAELIKNHLAVYEAEYPNSRYDYELRTVTE